MAAGYAAMALIALGMHQMRRTCRAIEPNSP